jgi:hypothetical protein
MVETTRWIAVVNQPVRLAKLADRIDDEARSPVNSHYIMDATLESRAGADSRGVVAKADMRDQPRVAARGLVTVYWRDEHQRIRRMHSLVRNVSGGGALVLSYRRLPVGAFVRVRSKKLYFLSGSGRVRHCHHIWGFASLIGLKLDSELAARF